MLRGNLECNPEEQHLALLHRLRWMHRLAAELAEHTVADSWEEPAIQFASELHWVLGDFLRRCEALEDLGQQELPF